MNASSENRSTRPIDSPARPKTVGTEMESPESDGVPQGTITVQCPNPACGKTYTVRSSYAGKDGRCKCGTVFSIPNVSPTPRNSTTAPVAEPRHEEEHAAAEDTVGASSSRPERRLRDESGVIEVRVGCIGRGHAGKTALLRTLGEGPVGDFFPSGLHVDAADPREVAQMIREAEEALHFLHQSGLPPTLQPSQIRYALYDGATQRVVYQLREVIGQVLTHTMPDSGAEQQARYSDYLKSLVNTQVLWVVIPCPPSDPSNRDRRRYANDLRITLAYLREALRLRSAEQPVTAALVLSKIDALFSDPEEARNALTDEVLRTSFGPLIHLVEQSPEVSDAVIVPVTAFGFGNAVLREEVSKPQETPAASEDELLGSEPIWLLREDASVQPYNLDTLFLWTLLFGLLNQAGQSAVEEHLELGRICRTLAEDLNARDPWLLRLKGGVLEETQAAEG